VLHDAITYIIGSIGLVLLTAAFLFMRTVAALPRQMIVVQAALFRLLRSNKLQGTALQKTALAMKTGCTNGETDDAVKAVIVDQNLTDEFFRKLAILKPKNLEELLKEKE
jgi:hypothetical protein